MPLLDALFVAQLTDEEDTVVLRDDDVVEALDDYLLAVGDTDHATGAFDDLDLVAHDSVAGSILWQEGVERTPCAEVTPAELGRHDVGRLRLLHDGIVDGDLGEGGIEFIDLGLLLGGEESGSNLIHDGSNLGGMLTELADDGLDRPEEHTAVPGVTTRGKILLGRGEVGFLAEGG